MKNEGLQTETNEVSLIDMVNFVKRNRKLILIWGIVGLSLATIYAVLSPEKYEVRWQIRMAQFSNSEEPAAVIQRLRYPTAYPMEVRQRCGVPEDGELSEYLGGMLKADVVKNVANTLDLKITLSSSGQAKKCAEAITAMIVAQQRGLIDEYLAERQIQLTQYRGALKEGQQQLEQMKISLSGNFLYLVKLDNLSWLRTRIDTLQEEIALAQLHPAKLIAPLYVPKTPVPRKVVSIALLGVLCGLMLAVLYGLGCEAWRRANANS